MVIDETYSLDKNQLKLVRFDIKIKTNEIVEFMLDKLSDDELKLVKFLTLSLPFRSSMDDDEKYWDIILLDYNVKMYLEHLLTKYKIKFTSKDITELYYTKSKKLDKNFIEDIDDFLDEILDVDEILDKINSIGIDNIKQYELMFLNRQSKKVT
jgi:hypothetical protein